MTLEEALDRGLVPTAPIVAYVESEKVYLDPNCNEYRQFYRMKEQQPYVSFDTADRFLCKLWLSVDAWHGPLNDIYNAVNLSGEPKIMVNSRTGERRCARPGCHNTFTPKKGAPKKGRTAPKYCSNSCRVFHSAQRRGKRPKRSESRLFMCKRGHEKSPDNRTADGKCRTCVNILQRERRRNKREASNG